MKKIIGVYKISNTLCPKCKYYIGYSCDIHNRWKNHFSRLKNNNHRNIRLQLAYNKYGPNCFTYEILHEYETKEEALKSESSYLKDLTIRDKLYNISYDNDTLTHNPNRERMIEKIKKSYKPRVPANVRSVIIDEVTYISAAEAGRKLGINHGTIKDRIHSYSPKFANYYYADVESKQKQGITKAIIPVIIDEVTYISASEAGRQLKIYHKTIIRRINSPNPKFTNYKYADIKKEAERLKEEELKLKEEELKLKESQELLSIRIENYKKQLPEIINKKTRGTSILIDNIYYQSMRVAAKITGIDRSTISRRIKSTEDQYNNYKFADTIQDEVKQPSLVL